MNLIQKEMLLKAAKLGCTVEGADADSPLEVRKDGKNICTIHSDKMTFQRGEDNTLLDQLIDIYHTVQEYTTAYEKATELIRNPCSQCGTPHSTDRLCQITPHGQNNSRNAVLKGVL